MLKIDLKKEEKELYNPSKKEPSLVEVPEMKFLIIDGEGILKLPRNTRMRWEHCFQFLIRLNSYLKRINHRIT